MRMLTHLRMHRIELGCHGLMAGHGEGGAGLGQVAGAALGGREAVCEATGGGGRGVTLFGGGRRRGEGGHLLQLADRSDVDDTRGVA